MTEVHIRHAVEKDIPGLYAVAAAVGSHHEVHYYERCLAEQDAGNRIVFVAEQEDRIVGYTNLVWSPIYAPFRRLGIPEIQDLNVIPAARRNGIGNRLVDTCEETAKKAGKDDIGLGVGLYAGYGAAQRIYVARGYMPDGAGVCYDDVTVEPGSLRAVDDNLTLKMVKNLAK